MEAAFTRSGQETTLFILAHPDDELIFAPILDRLVRQAKPVLLIYLADGAPPGSSTSVRHAETHAALSLIGMHRSSVKFLGSEHGIGDGQLYKHLPRALDS